MGSDQVKESQTVSVNLIRDLNEDELVLLLYKMSGLEFSQREIFNHIGMGKAKIASTLKSLSQKGYIQYRAGIENLHTVETLSSTGLSTQEEGDANQVRVVYTKFLVSEKLKNLNLAKKILFFATLSDTKCAIKTSRSSMERELEVPGRTVNSNLKNLEELGLIKKIQNGHSFYLKGEHPIETAR